MKFKDCVKSVIATLKTLKKKDANLGLNAEKTSINAIISLTSIPSRLPILHIAIRSLLDQDVYFEKVVLWLHQDLKTAIPKKLECLLGCRFEIKFSETSEPHRKLVETLKLYPQTHIVTCDDDMIYPNDWLRRLIAEHQKSPEAIVAHMCRKVRVENNEILPYKMWHSENLGASSDNTLALGWGGVLYPPASLHPRVLDRDSYMHLAPKADDLWFKAMSMLVGTKTRKSSAPYPEPVPILNSQSVSLKAGNIDRDENRTQLMQLVEKYKLKFSSDKERA